MDNAPYAVTAGNESESCNPGPFGFSSFEQARAADSIIGVVLAGGQGSRLAPLTMDQAKPAVPFGPQHRIIDFALSNLFNSGFGAIHVLVQHNASSIKDHLRLAWQPLMRRNALNTVQPRGRVFKGTADAVRQSLDAIGLERGGLVVVFGADHVYRMDVNQMIDFHRAHAADVTVAALRVARSAARAFGVIGCDRDGRIESFLEKPDEPPAMPDEPSQALASMGNYVFTTDCLLRALREPACREEPDFGHDVLPRLLRQGSRVYAYDFASNRVPGTPPHEQPAYWRDVGTVDAYFNANLDTLGTRPLFDLSNPHWPIRMAARSWPPARLVRSTLRNTHVGAGALIRGASVRDSIVRRGAIVQDGAELEQCVVMDHGNIGKGARLRRTIVDCNAVVPPHARIGFDPEYDARYWTVTPEGITVVAHTARAAAITA
jgi:glucose-1-phosphate adenylyltransferase